jgi:predicted unusual protein kinase regulating ubiquinone biosynthesis (AarF/ABC1/UbiB family)
MMNLARKYGITVDIQMLRFIRSTLLFESMAVRLHPEIDYVKQYQVFKDYRAEQARRRVTDSILNQMDEKGNEQTIIRLDRIAHAAEGLVFRASHMLSLPSVNFNALMSKWSFAVYSLLRFAGQTVILTLVFAFLANFRLYLSEQHFMNVYESLQAVVTNPVYQVIFFIMLLVHGRTVLFRLDDKEVSQ